MLFNLLVSNANNKTTPDTPDTPTGGDLPAGFTKVNYLLCEANQFVTLPYYANAKTTITIDFKITKASNAQCIFDGTGTEKYSNNDPKQAFFVRSGNFKNGSASGSTTLMYSSCGLNRTVYITLGNAGLSSGSSFYSIDRFRCVFGQATLSLYNMDTNTHLYTKSHASFEGDKPFLSDTPLKLLSYRSTAYSKMTGRFYSATVEEDGVLLFDLIPVVNADGIAGVFDLIGQVFYRSEGTLEFGYE